MVRSCETIWNHTPLVGEVHFFLASYTANTTSEGFWGSSNEEAWKLSLKVHNKATIQGEKNKKKRLYIQKTTTTPKYSVAVVFLYLILDEGFSRK